MRTRDQNIVRVEQQLLEWGAKIEALAKRAEAAGEHARADYRRRIEDLKTQRAEAMVRLSEFKAAGTETWEAFRSGIEVAWRELEVALKALSREEPTSPLPAARAGPRRAPPPRPKTKAAISKGPKRHRAVGR
jgi:hypothetical protein